MLNATVTVCVFKFSSRNPKIIVRRPSHVTSDTPDKIIDLGKAKQRKVKRQAEAAALYQARSVLENAQATTCPVLLIHGDADPVTPVGESGALADALGERAQLVVLPNEGHTWRSEGAIARTLQLELDFLRGIIGSARHVH